MSPEEDWTRDAVDSEPKHYQLSYSGPQTEHYPAMPFVSWARYNWLDSHLMPAMVGQPSDASWPNHRTGQTNWPPARAIEPDKLDKLGKMASIVPGTFTSNPLPPSPLLTEELVQ